MNTTRKARRWKGSGTGNEGDKVICLYPPVDEYAGISIFDAVRVGSPTIYMRNLSTASGALQHDDPSSISDVDLMLGEVLISGDVAHVYLEHQFAVFRIEVTLRNFPYEAPDGSPFDQARINSIRIKCVDPDSDEEEEWGVNGDPVFVRFSGLDVTTGSYTGTPFTIERGPQDYYLLDSGRMWSKRPSSCPSASTRISRRDMNSVSSSAATITTTRRNAGIRSPCSRAATCGRRSRASSRLKMVKSTASR